MARDDRGLRLLVHERAGRCARVTRQAAMSQRTAASRHHYRQDGGESPGCRVSERKGGLAK
jgi:hypothetical protein